MLGRFYSDVTPNWNAILDIANTAHEWNMARFHRPGSWAFMDMLEAGVTDKNGSTYLSYEESRSHVALCKKRPATYQARCLLTTTCCRFDTCIYAD